MLIFTPNFEYIEVKKTKLPNLEISYNLSSANQFKSELQKVERSKENSSIQTGVVDVYKGDKLCGHGFVWRNSVSTTGEDYFAYEQWTIFIDGEGSLSYLITQGVNDTSEFSETVFNIDITGGSGKFQGKKGKVEVNTLEKLNRDQGVRLVKFYFE